MSTEDKNVKEVKEKKGIIPVKIKTNELMANVVDKASKTGKKGVEVKLLLTRLPREQGNFRIKQR